MGENIIELNHVSHQYASMPAYVLKDINLALPAGKKIALLGGNGAGKSTLMLLLNGIIRPVKGFLTFHSEKVKYDKKFLRKLRSSVGLLFQEPDDQLIAPSVFEEISFGLYNLKMEKHHVRKKVEQMLTAFNLSEYQDHPPHLLSAGEKKRVCLASVIAMEPEMIVCDEPASSLDPWHSKLTFQKLDELNQQGKTILISTHDVDHAYSWADHVILMYKGVVLTSGRPKEVLSQEHILKKAYLKLPFIVESCLSSGLSLNPEELPCSMEEFKQFIQKALCMDS